MFVYDGVLVGVDVVSKGTGRCGPKVGEELVLGVERDDGEREFVKVQYLKVRLALKV